MKRGRMVRFLKRYSNEKLQFPHYLVTPMPMEGEERFWNPQNRDGVPGGQKTFYNGSLWVWGPTVKCPKHLEGTNVKICKMLKFFNNNKIATVIL